MVNSSISNVITFRWGTTSRDCFVCQTTYLFVRPYVPHQSLIFHQCSLNNSPIIGGVVGLVRHQKIKFCSPTAFVLTPKSAVKSIRQTGRIFLFITLSLILSNCCRFIWEKKKKNVIIHYGQEEWRQNESCHVISLQSKLNLSRDGHNNSWIHK